MAKKYVVWQAKHRDFLKNLMGRIEIINDSGELEVLYFKIPEKVKLYWNTFFIKEYRE